VPTSWELGRNWRTRLCRVARRHPMISIPLSVSYSNHHEQQPDNRTILSIAIRLTSGQGAREQLKAQDSVFLSFLSP